MSSRKRINPSFRSLLANWARLTAFLLLVSIAAFGFTLSDYTKAPPESWKKPTDPPPLKLGYWDFRQFKKCHVPLVLLTKRPKDERLPKGIDDKPISHDAVWGELVAAVDAWNSVQPAVLKIDLTDNSPGWPESGGIPIEPYQDDYMNAFFWMDFQGRGQELEPGQTKPHPGTSWLGIEEEMHNTDIRLMLHQVHWTTDQASHNLSANPKIIDIRTVAIHEIGHFLGLGHTSENPSDEDVPSLGGPVMFYKVSKVKRELHDDDKLGLNFLYTPDLGHAPFPKQTPVHTETLRKTADEKEIRLNEVPVYEPGPGAVHLLGFPPFEFELLGKTMDGECDPNDTEDDGVKIRGEWKPGGVLTIEVEVSTRNEQGELGQVVKGRYDKSKMYLNAWADWDGNKHWDNAPPEKIIGTDTETKTQAFEKTETGTYRIQIPASAEEKTLENGIWFRFRLDWAEDAGKQPQIWSSKDLKGPQGMAAFGEVEDYFIDKQKLSAGFTPPVTIPVTIPVGPGGTCKGKTPELGSIQIHELWATITNCSTGQPLPEGTLVTFTIHLKPGVQKLQNVSDLDSITVAVPGFEPVTVKTFTVQTVTVPSLPPAPPVSIKIINVGTVCLKPK